MSYLPGADRIPVRYWRAALAEVCLLHPLVQSTSKAVEIGEFEGKWRIITAAPDVSSWVAEQFSTSKARPDGSSSKTIPFVLIPARLSRDVSHGIKLQADEAHEGLSVLCVPCLLDRGGGLWPDPERDPWIPRDLLEPTLSKVSIGRLEDYDKFVSGLPGKPEFFGEVLQFAAELFRVITDTTLPLLARSEEEAGDLPLFTHDGYELVSEWHGVAYQPPVIARRLIKLYDQIVEKAPVVPLFDSLRTFADRPSYPPPSLSQAEASYAKTVGHISRTHPLSASQREAMVELASLQEGQLLSVNGPPGTGKTTLLHSAVAQVWVSAALRGAECPLIVVTSTNGTAVENVLESFSKIAAEIRHERWHPYQGGFGIFFAADGRETRYPTCTATQHAYAEYETVKGVAAAEEYYLSKASAFFRREQSSLEDVVKALRGQLQEYDRKLKMLVEERYNFFRLTGQSTTEGAATSYAYLLKRYRGQIEAEQTEIDAADQEINLCEDELRRLTHQHEEALRTVDLAEENWNAYLANSPLWLDFLSFLPPIRRRRNARDRIFLISNPLTADRQHRGDHLEQAFSVLRQVETRRATDAAERIKTRRLVIDERHRSALQRKKEAEEFWTRIDEDFQRWNVAVKGGYDYLLDVPLDRLNDQLDLNLRAPMFGFSDWYWSGQWLIEMKSRLATGQADSKGPAKLEAKYRRFAKLAPCIVSNFHIAPSFFTAWYGVEIPLWNTIDLMIVDEAGQVSPDVGAAMFALAKRALVVGDVYQIEPVWNNGEGTDRMNAVKFGLISSPRDLRYDRLAELGYAPARGNLMRIANRSCATQKHPDQRGLMLTEHRRCVPEIIGYNNELIYRGRLEPKRPGIEPAKRLLPAFGYFGVVGVDKVVAKSRRNIEEAAAIVAWLNKYRERIEGHYLDEHGLRTPLWKLVGIITPFACQVGAIEQQLRKKMPDLARKESRLTVGTVHALQGAERAIVIFSPTYGSAYTGGTFFDQKPNMLNVAVSRAKDSFLVFGNLSLFNAKIRSRPSGLLAAYLFGSAGKEV